MHNNKIYAMEAVDEDQGDLVREQLFKKYEMQQMQTRMKLNVAWGLFFASTIVSTTLSLGSILGTYTEEKVQMGQTAAKVVNILPVPTDISISLSESEIQIPIKKAGQILGGYPKEKYPGASR